MAISTRFSVAVHTLALLEMNRQTQVTSAFIAGSVGTNAVVIRRIMADLKKAGLISTRPGIGGTYLLKNSDEITLLDIYRAVQSEAELFDMHKNPNPDCLVGANIQYTLDDIFLSAKQKMENELNQFTLYDVTKKIQEHAR